MSDKCQHHWIIGRPEARGFARGYCRKCGSKREFLQASENRLPPFNPMRNGPGKNQKKIRADMRARLQQAGDALDPDIAAAAVIGAERQAWKELSI